MQKHVYVADQIKGFNFTAIVEEKRVHVRFVNGQFTTDDDKLADAIDALCKGNPGIGRRCRKTDQAAAEKLAREHRARLAGTGAIKGGVTADAMKRSMDTTLQQRDTEMRKQHVDPADFVDENLQMTEKAAIIQAAKIDAPVVAAAIAKTAVKLGDVLSPKPSILKIG